MVEVLFPDVVAPWLRCKFPVSSVNNIYSCISKGAGGESGSRAGLSYEEGDQLFPGTKLGHPRRAIRNMESRL